ncbi:hypothetical protein FD47_GL002081 [Lentilactobacillus parafarraginis DSM 18390 = JCM 14109]|uniref:Uncharacterized protein n=1 Tax=Lentilactobacillus parafarraginis DSM 18390 = JCM 14109 TaxID=1423786 RepID=A0A0R1YTN0_9LACO|nr:hypothetical protein FD47_GL002081 [Lentilactobacillus parafarraginis DSM 18390 = JCM 14109]
MIGHERLAKGLATRRSMTSSGLRVHNGLTAAYLQIAISKSIKKSPHIDNNYRYEAIILTHK